MSTSSLSATTRHKQAPEQLLGEDSFEIVQHARQGEDDPVNFRLDPQTESIRATQAQIAALFETDRSNVAKQLAHIFSEDELLDLSNVKKLHIASSTKATRFRQWAT